MTFPNPNNPGPEKNPALAHVIFTNEKEMGPVIVLRDAGEDLPALLKASLAQLGEQKVDLGPGTWAAAFIFHAVARGCHVDILPPPPGQHAAMQMAAIFHPDAAFGGVGWVVVNTTGTEVLTYGGRGFPAIAEASPHTPASYDLKDLFALVVEHVEDAEVEEIEPEKPSAAELLEAATPEQDAPLKPTKKRAPRKKAAKKGKVIKA